MPASPARCNGTGLAVQPLPNGRAACRRCGRVVVARPNMTAPSHKKEAVRCPPLAPPRPPRLGRGR